MFKATSLCTLLLLAACSQAAVPALSKNENIMLNPVVSGSYIVKAPGEGEQVIRSVFAEYEISLVRSLGNDQYELRLNRDPGIDTLNKLVSTSDGKIKSIQPNFVYRIN